CCINHAGIIILVVAMRYNAKTTDMLRKPVPVGDDLSIILAERSLGISLPESVREWYSEIDGRGVLSRYSNDDWALDPMQQATIRWLESRFVSEPQSVGWPGVTTYRFSTSLERIIIWNSEGQADWILTASSSDALDHLKQQVSAVW